MSPPRALWKAHWPEYLIEAWALGTFMLSAAAFGVLLEWPGSAVRHAIADPGVRRALAGVAMGLTAVALTYSPWGKRSGAHMNPAVTLAFYVLGRIRGADAIGYAVAQVLGGLAGVLLAIALFGSTFTASPVSYVQTLPGPGGAATAFLAEVAISFGLLITVLKFAERPVTERYAGLAAGALVALYIAFEAPLSGMSMNPARSLASAVPASNLAHFWLYTLAPCLGMLAAAGVSRLFSVPCDCAKLRHDAAVACIHCGHTPAPLSGARP